jgi:tetratricopeptide (TPR) repeat protein
MFTLCFMVVLSLAPQVASQPGLGAPRDGMGQASLEAIGRLIDEGKLDAARRQLQEELRAQRENYQTLFLQARILFAEKRHEESLKQLERSFALHRQDARVYLLAGLNWVILERLDLARPFFEEAARLAPGDGTMHYHLGRYYYSAQRFPQAEQAFRAALKLNADSVKTYDNLGLALEAQTKVEEAEASYRKAIELADAQRLETEWPWLNLAKLLVEKGRHEESLALLESAQRMNPKSAEVCYVRGKVLLKLGQEAEAEAALRRSVQNDAKFPDSHYLLGRIYLRQGRKSESQREMEIFQGLKESSRPKGGAMVSGSRR